MKHKQLTILIFLAIFSFLFSSNIVVSMEEDGEYYMDDSIDCPHTSFTMQCIANSGQPCHSTGSKHINRDYLFFNSNSKAYQDQLDGVSCVLSKKNNKFPVVVVNNYLKISINNNNTLKFTTKKNQDITHFSSLCHPTPIQYVIK